MQAFLTMIAISEGTQDHPLSHWQGYDVIVTGEDGKPEIFSDFSDHPFAARPPKVISSKCSPVLRSSAAGRYQQIFKYWPYYKNLLKLNNFGPVAQDQVAIQLIKERQAWFLVENGRFDAAVSRCKNIWASLPGAGYNQHENSIDMLRIAYVQCGGKLA